MTSETHSEPWRWALLLIVILLAGCSGVKTYSNTLPKNMHVNTKLDSGSVFTSTVAEFDIHKVNARCETDYVGRVYLEDAATEVGLPVGGSIFLDFIFASKRYLSSDISAIRYDTLVTPRAGYDYKADVSYINGIYNVVIREISRDGSVVSTIKRRPLSSCSKHS